MSSLSKTITKIRNYIRRNPQQVDRGRRIVRDRLSRRRGGSGGQGNPPRGSI
ncbi:hypothetical protein [Streptomyces sp. SID3343]|uniref:hypothetical protein n=1 Tax=Streptomyces sp. SID3343 TaxID=2690260 RepID=UPI00136E58E7|nr:hypothetical protein [Streptomyces sp. SID3343]MYW00126.1 hypothetical protein [Streptomyces sp. SID3343]